MSDLPPAGIDESVPLGRLRACFEGAMPAVIATAAADGTPNVTYLSKVRMVDDEHIALSNQFFSKTSRNLAENPFAAILLIDPAGYDEYRLDVAYERTDRRGPMFDQLREDVEAVAAMHGMQDVFRLRAADIYRVVAIEHRPAPDPRRRRGDARGRRPSTGPRTASDWPSSPGVSVVPPISTPGRQRARRPGRAVRLRTTPSSCSPTRGSSGSTPSPATGTTPRAWARRW